MDSKTSFGYVADAKTMYHVACSSSDTVRRESTVLQDHVYIYVAAEHK